MIKTAGFFNYYSAYSTNVTHLYLNKYNHLEGILLKIMTWIRRLDIPVATQSNPQISISIQMTECDVSAVAIYSLVYPQFFLCATQNYLKG